MLTKAIVAVLLSLGSSACFAGEPPTVVLPNRSLSPANVSPGVMPGTDHPPKFVSGKAPVYPISMLLSGTGGSCAIEFTVGVDGRAKDFKILSTPDKFADHAIIAVSSWVLHQQLKMAFPSKHACGSLSLTPRDRGLTIHSSRSRFAARLNSGVRRHSMHNGNREDRKIRTLLALAALWLVIAAFLAFQFWPNVPHSTLKWALFIVFGPPLYVLGEEFFGWLLSPKHGTAFSPHRFSAKRILIALPIVVAVVALGWWLSWLISSP
jgi:hypothetical protein